jgi:DNA replication initiation complex subunit (GINS family)
MPEIKITFETLYDILRNERNRTELQKLESTFYEDTINYLEEKKAILKSQEEKKSIFTNSEVQKTRKQIENIQKIIKDIYTTRENKILHLALISSKSNNQLNNIGNMLKEEREFYEEMIYILNNYRQNILNNLISGKAIQSKPLEPKDLKDKELPTKIAKYLTFIKEVPSFVGTDLEKYGPFEKEDKAQIPIEIANLLINSKKAIENENT